MEVVRGCRALVRRPRAPAVAIGNFDGVHRGHRRLFEEIRRLAGATLGQSVALTFDPHPVRLLAPHRAPPLICTPARKLELIAAAGVDLCLVEPFDHALAQLDPAAFVERILLGALGVRAVCVGHDFSFGHGRQGNAELLFELGRRHGFEVAVVAPVAEGGVVCSSSRVRRLVGEGRVDEAAPLLGRDHEVEGEVVRGDGRGRTIGVPTANLAPSTELLPAPGVYAGWAELPDGHRHLAAMSFGTNPTFRAGGSASAMRLEAHLLDYLGGDLYGVRLRLGLRRRLRHEQRFSSVAELRSRIQTDLVETRAAMAERE